MMTLRRTFWVMWWWMLLVLLLVPLLEGVDGRQEEEVEEKSLMNFLALGDWGGAPLVGSLPDQRKTAGGMDRVAKERNAEFVIALGDNFYRTGVNSVTSKRFDSTFESVYNTHPNLMSLPWYVIGGNHDHRGNIDAQILYSQYNPQWKFPSLYHSHTFTTTHQDGNDDELWTVDLIMIDTVDLCSLNELDDEQAEGYYDPLPYLPKSHAMEQWDWLEQRLAKSTADYILVAGHYPVFSVCSHGPTETLIRHLRPLLKTYGAHYLAGHDHCMNHFVDNDNDDDVHYVLTGTGIGCCAPADHLDNPQNNKSSLLWRMTRDTNRDGYLWNKHVKGGFTSFSITPQHMKIIYHNHNGDDLFHVPPIPPRSPNQKQHPNDNHTTTNNQQQTQIN